MAVEERDPHTGYLTTGHEWNGITELNRPVPRLVWIVLAITVLYSVVTWVLVPAWPLGTTYTPGVLGIDQRTSVAESLERAAQARSGWASRIEAEDHAAILADAELMHVVRNTAPTLFADNCALCHGAGGRGGPGYPSLVDGTWLWGGSPEEVAQTIRVGINSSHPDTRFSEMPAFGRDAMLPRPAIQDVTAFVRALANPALAATADPAQLARGREVFDANCGACHGPDGRGIAGTGAADLTTGNWIYGGDLESVFASIFHGRQGHMPHWEGRLSPLEQKLLTLHVLDLAEGPR